MLGCSFAWTRYVMQRRIAKSACFIMAAERHVVCTEIAFIGGDENAGQWREWRSQFDIALFFRGKERRVFLVLPFSEASEMVLQ